MLGYYAPHSFKEKYLDQSTKMSEFLTGNTDLKITNPYHMGYLKWLHFKPSTGDSRIPARRRQGCGREKETEKEQLGFVLDPLKNTFKTWAVFKWQMTGDTSFNA